MDLIFTNAERTDQGVLSAHLLDLSYGASENDFELTIGASEPTLETDACIYIEGTEYGGMVGGIKSSTHGETITYKGRTWHGILNSKVIQPDTGENYLVVSGDANEVLSFLIARLGLSELFVANENPSGVNISRYQFHRYCKGYDGVCDMLTDNGAKLKLAWKDRAVVLSAEPIADYTESPVDGDVATLSVEQNNAKVNHLICLGKGNLAEREVVHLYVDQNGDIGDVQYYTGVAEIVDTYDNNNAEDLRSDGVKKLEELRNSDKAEIDISETEGLSYDIGDIVGASELKSGVKVAETVTQKIIKISNGTIQTEYKTGGAVSRTSDDSGSGSNGGGSSDTGDNPDSGGDTEPPVPEYELPVASESTLGGVMIGDNITIDDSGKMSVDLSGVVSYAEQSKTDAEKAQARENIGVGAVIVESGTSGVYSYRKWSDGTKECWCTASATRAINTASGASGIVLSAAAIFGSYPSGLFSAPPACKIELLGITDGTTEYNGWLYTVASGTAARSPQMRIARIGSAISSATVTFSIYAIGV